jgi:hypothetical protein
VARWELQDDPHSNRLLGAGAVEAARTASVGQTLCRIGADCEPGLFGSEPELFMKVGRVAEGSAAPLGC